MSPGRIASQIGTELDGMKEEVTLTEAEKTIMVNSE